MMGFNWNERFIRFEDLGSKIQKKMGLKGIFFKSIFYPELDEKESVVWPFVKQILQASLLLWELVVDLPDVHRLQIGVAVAWVGLADVYKQVLVELKRQKCISGVERSQKMTSVTFAKLPLTPSALWGNAGHLSHRALCSIESYLLLNPITCFRGPALFLPLTPFIIMWCVGVCILYVVKQIILVLELL